LRNIPQFAVRIQENREANKRRESCFDLDSDRVVQRPFDLDFASQCLMILPDVLAVCALINRPNNYFANCASNPSGLMIGFNSE
jgi:hypothetical protein